MTGQEAIKHSLLLLFLLAAAEEDIRKMRIPNRLIETAWGLRFLIFIVECIGTEGKMVIEGGFIFAGSILLTWGLALFALLSRHGFGFGDVKLAGTMALYQGVEETLTCLLYGLLLAGCISLSLSAAGRINRKAKLPLAPFFLAGYMWMLLWKSC